jgi:2-succinyl-6-hydroxy-2,4-cyclohexadiene-1-carboxylate synthase
MAETVVLLHGFAGTRHAWDLVADRLDPERYRPLALDLRGHGDARDRRPITFEACVADVAAAAPERFVLCGYSLGGRLALHVALAHRDRVSRLVLVASTAGIEDPALREERRAADVRLAADTERGTIEQFAERWSHMPLFAGTPPFAAKVWRADLLRNDPKALAEVLRGLGAGTMPPLWERLPELDGLPVTIIVGERDGRYTATGRRLAAGLPGARLLLVPGAGHGLPREAPQAVAAAIATE